MIVVTGATGELGRAIVQKLVGLVPAAQVGASVRDPGKARELEALGVRVRRGDFGDPDSLPHAFEGTEQLLIVSSNARASGGDPLAQHRSAVEAARAVGVRRIIYTSHMAANGTSAFPPMLDHAATEGMLAACGTAWTALRNGFYAASGIALMGDALETGVIEAPADGKVAWTAHADLAEAAAIVLAGGERFEGPTPPLTGAEALDLGDMAGIASDLLGRPVRRETITEELLRAKMTARGAPEGAVAMVSGLHTASRAGEFAPADPTLARLLGRTPTSMRALIAQKLRG
ncbi:NAD(P)H-binding protein [uncultured Sphingomonas sp.]|uniref:NAD(P)H-binding protein n=1 Tax=uncultured Sphingomonas sp. TaxID=158754 RepID=UPI0035CA6C64